MNKNLSSSPGINETTHHAEIQIAAVLILVPALLVWPCRLLPWWGCPFLWAAVRLAWLVAITYNERNHKEKNKPRVRSGYEFVLKTARPEHHGCTNFEFVKLDCMEDGANRTTLAGKVSLADLEAPANAANYKCSTKTSSEIELYLQQPFNTEMYEHRPYRCFRCEKLMLVFNWRGHALHDSEPPPEPRPLSVQKRDSRGVRGSYWANVCLNCDTIQGDFYVFDECESLDWSFPIE